MTTHEIKRASLTVVDPFGSVPLDRADFDQIIPLGEGNQGTVYAVSYTQDGISQKYVLKKLKKKRKLPSCSVTSYPSDCFNASVNNFTDGLLHCVKKITRKPDKKRLSFDAHIKITDEHDSPNSHNIVKLEGIVEHNGEEYALIHFCDIFLCDLIAENFQGLKEEDHMLLVCEISLDIIEALKYLNYYKNYTHRDINKFNIARCDGKWCLIDFESAVEVGIKNASLAGSPLYIHPSGYYDSSNLSLPGNDLYALGRVIKDMLLEPHEYVSQTFHEIVKEKVDRFRNDIHEKWGSDTPTKFDDPIENSLKRKTTREKIIDLSNRMCSLMSSQPSIDDLCDCFHEIRRNLLEPSSPKLMRDYLSSFSSDGYFSSSTRDYEILKKKRESLAWKDFVEEFSSSSDQEEEC